MRIRRVTTHLLNGESIRPPIGGFGWRPRTAFAQSVTKSNQAAKFNFRPPLRMSEPQRFAKGMFPILQAAHGEVHFAEIAPRSRIVTRRFNRRSQLTQCVRLAVNEHRSREVPVILRTPSARVRIIRRGLCQFLSYDVFCLRRPTHAEFFQSFVNRIDQRRFPPTQLHELANKLLNARKRLRSFFRRIVLVDRLSACLLIPVV